jgi:hypothetical protein
MLLLLLTLPLSNTEGVELNLETGDDAVGIKTLIASLFFIPFSFNSNDVKFDAIPLSLLIVSTMRGG